ncbi:uncharacterized protein [Aegilops tauschii subsp. strangulata]|uniref:uncharacterized protein n=1 Tax=Aegilops tauschii subsp. strangulata TaxID=200361 RepID=UPI003CC8B6ED
MWERSENLTEIVHNAWKEGDCTPSLRNVATNLKSMRDVLGRWAQKEFSSVLNSIKSLRARLQSLRLQPRSRETDENIKKIEAELDEWLFREEVMSRQRSRISWLREGHKNTEFFHRKANWRRKKNKIEKLKKEDGSWTENTKDIHIEINRFFKDLYKKDEGVRPQKLIDLIPRKVEAHMNDALTRPISDSEVGDTLFQIRPLKAPGPDGFLARFFQRNWAVLREDVTKGVQKKLMTM